MENYSKRKLWEEICLTTPLPKPKKEKEKKEKRKSRVELLVDEDKQEKIIKEDCYFD